MKLQFAAATCRQDEFGQIVAVALDANDFCDVSACSDAHKECDKGTTSEELTESLLA